MLENALIQLMRSSLLPLMASQGLGAVSLKQSAQPTQQGRPVGDLVFFQIIGPGSHNVGSPQRFSRFNVGADQYEQGLRQPVTTSFQFGAIVNVDPASTTQLTAADVLKRVALIMMSDVYMAPLLAQNVNIMRITDVRGAAGVSDRGQFQLEPSFDVTLSHVDEIVFDLDEVTAFEHQLYAI